jgi:queuosine precursor transporter
MSESDRSSGLVSVAVVSSLYVAAQLLSNVTSLRILMIAGFSMDAGTLIYPFTFTLRDLVHKTGGIKVARAVVITAAAANLFMAGLYWLVARLPPDMGVGAQLEFGRVLSPTWRLVIASIVAQIASELVDGQVYQAWVNKVGHKLQWMRVLTSNSVSVPLDSALFCGLAFIGRMPFFVVVSIFWANVILKGITTLVSLPWIYLVKEKPEARSPQPR